MKNPFVYHAIADLPYAVILYPWIVKEMSTGIFVFLSFAYAFVYRPVIDYYRLKALGTIAEGDYREILRFGTIGYRFKYYSTLMFGK